MTHLVLPSRLGTEGTGGQGDNGGNGDGDGDGDEQPKEAPNFETSGLLAKETNMFNGVEVIYTEPQEARKTKTKWRLYPFKGEQALEPLHIHRQSAYLIGKEKRVCDIHMAHPSISKQHAALQYRLLTDKSTGRAVNRVVPCIIDLESTNGTLLNGDKIQPRRYFELQERDVLKFGNSTRDYVLLNEHSNQAAAADGM